MFDTIRLSENFILLDFMYDYDMYMYRHPLDLDEVWDDETQEVAEDLCQNLLEPCIERYGPCSIAGAFWPELVRTRGGHFQPGPHEWNAQNGCAADVFWHEPLARGRAPIHIAEDLDKHTDIDYNRLITYAGSEGICMSRCIKFNRHALHENRRIPGASHKYINHGDYRKKNTRKNTAITPTRTDTWRRGYKETPMHKPMRAQHIRTGKYFVLLDFCRNVLAIKHGVCTVPPAKQSARVAVSRMFSEILDPVVAQYGRLTVLRGMEPNTYNKQPDAEYHKWDAHSVNHKLEFLLHSNTDLEEVLNLIRNHSGVVSTEYQVHPLGGIHFSLLIKRFEPQVIWKSHT